MLPVLWQTKSGASLKEAHILALPVTTLCVSLIASFNWHMLIAVHIYRLHICTYCVIIQSIYMWHDQVKSTNTSIFLNIYDFFFLGALKSSFIVLYQVKIKCMLLYCGSCYLICAPMPAFSDSYLIVITTVLSDSFLAFVCERTHKLLHSVFALFHLMSSSSICYHIG